MISLIEANPDYEKELSAFKQEIMMEDADSEDDRLVGVIDLRHHINHPVLGIW